MATITIKNIPDDLYERLKLSATKNRRSINQEAIFIIESSLANNAVSFQTNLAEVRALREQLGVYVTDEEIDQAKNEGRP